MGSTWGRGDQTGAFRWTKSKGMEVLNTPATHGARANAINSAGTIAGALAIGDPYDTEVQTGVLWTSAGDAIDINACLCTYSAVAINQSGETTGYTRAGTPFRWSPSRTLTTLDLLGRATAINDRGDIVGTQNRSGEGFVWTHAGLTTLPRRGNRLTRPNGINNSGQIVGSVR